MVLCCQRFFIVFPCSVKQGSNSSGPFSCIGESFFLKGRGGSACIGMTEEKWYLQNRCASIRYGYVYYLTPQNELAITLAQWIIKQAFSSNSFYNLSSMRHKSHTACHFSSKHHLPSCWLSNRAEEIRVWPTLRFYNSTASTGREKHSKNIKLMEHPQLLINTVNTPSLVQCSIHETNRQTTTCAKKRKGAPLTARHLATPSQATWSRNPTCHFWWPTIWGAKHVCKNWRSAPHTSACWQSASLHGNASECRSPEWEKNHPLP